MTQLRNRLAGVAGAVALGIAALPFPPAPARAQQIPGTPGTQAAEAQDPPDRVGRIARLSGTVSFRTTEDSTWEAATVNYPVTSQNAFWTEPSAFAEFDLGSAHMALDQATELDIDMLDDHQLAAAAVQGALYLRIDQTLPGDIYQITTPRGMVTIAKPGRYEIVAGDTGHPTMVTVVEGAAELDIGSGALAIGQAQTAQVTGSDDLHAAIVAAPQDAFLTARLEAERAPPPPPPAPAVAGVERAAPPPVVQQMTGGAAIMNIGVWASSKQYDRIWYPPVAADWVPYRHGHWGYVAPWGWTWIDDAPWGFAPFHYGRWVQDGPRWGWVPTQPGVKVTVTARPTYAPALVSFIGLSASVTVAPGRPAPRPGRPPPGPRPGFGGSVGWVPLGPQEVYRPPYRTSTKYVRNVNVTNVRNVTNITNVTVNNNVTINKLANRRAATVVPADVLTASQPVAAKVERVAPERIAQARPERAVPVQPTRATIGVTPVVAQRLKLKPEPAATGAEAPHREAPGPKPEPRDSGRQIVPKAAAPAPAAPARPGRPRPPEATAEPQPVTLPKLRPAAPAAAPQSGPAQPSPAPASPAPGRPTAQPDQAPRPGQRPAVPPDAAKPHPATPAPATPAPATPAPAAPAQPTPRPSAAPGPAHPATPPAAHPPQARPNPDTPAPAAPPAARPPATQPVHPAPAHPAPAAPKSGQGGGDHPNAAQPAHPGGNAHAPAAPPPHPAPAAPAAPANPPPKPAPAPEAPQQQRG